MSDDLISRQAAIDIVVFECGEWIGLAKEISKQLKQLPSAQPEIKPIEYRDCTNAMLEMWMDGVVTDGEYNRIMDKLNAYWRKDEDE